MLRRDYNEDVAGYEDDNANLKRWAALDKVFNGDFKECDLKQSLVQAGVPDVDDVVNFFFEADYSVYFFHNYSFDHNFHFTVSKPPALRPNLQAFASLQIRMNDTVFLQPRFPDCKTASSIPHFRMGKF